MSRTEKMIAWLLLLAVFLAILLLEKEPYGRNLEICNMAVDFTEGSDQKIDFGNIAAIDSAQCDTLTSRISAPAGDARRLHAAGSSHDRYGCSPLPAQKKGPGLSSGSLGNQNSPAPTASAVGPATPLHPRQRMCQQFRPP